MTGLAPRRVSPFGHPEIIARVQLPQAFRSLPRPSSPLDAKASTVCLIAFDLDLVGTASYYGLDSLATTSSSLQLSKSRINVRYGMGSAGDTEGLSPRARGTALTRRSRKEVIQPQVPLRLPCYDFTPVTEHSLGACLPCGLA